MGDKRSQVVYDLDLADADPQVADAVQELLTAETFAAFGPDTLAEARNRGYHPHKSIRRRGRGERIDPITVFPWSTLPSFERPGPDALPWFHSIDLGHGVTTKGTSDRTRR